MAFLRLHARGLAIGLLAIVIALASHAASATEGDRAALAAALLQKSQTRNAVEAWRTMLLAPGSIPNCGCGADGQARMDAAWRTAVNETFDVSAVFAKMHLVFAGSFTAGELKKMLAFRDSTLGRKVTALERAQNSQHTGQSAFLAEIAAMRKALARDRARKRLLEDITAALGGVDAQVDVLLNFSLGAAIGIGTAAPDGPPRLMPDEIVARVEANRPAMREMLAPLVLYNNASIYKSLRIEELKKYRDLLVSELGRKSSRIVLAAFSGVLRAQALAIGARFARELDAQHL